MITNPPTDIAFARRHIANGLYDVATAASIAGAARAVLLRTLHDVKRPIYCATESTQTENRTLITNPPPDVAFAQRHIASELKEAVKKHHSGVTAHAEMLKEIDAITEQAAALGLCRHAWESDPHFEPKGLAVRETRGRKPKPHIPGIDSIGRI